MRKSGFQNDNLLYSTWRSARNDGFTRCREYVHTLLGRRHEKGTVADGLAAIILYSNSWRVLVYRGPLPTNVLVSSETTNICTKKHVTRLGEVRPSRLQTYLFDLPTRRSLLQAFYDGVTRCNERTYTLLVGILKWLADRLAGIFLQRLVWVCPGPLPSNPMYVL